MLRCQDSLQDVDDRQRHHAMRIAAKRLRYTVEIAKPVYGPALDEILAAVKRVQTLLGDIHDCDVWLEHLDAYAAAQRRQTIAAVGRAARFARLEAGINYLRQDRRCHRQQVFEEMVDYWRQLRQQGFWDNLVAVVAARLRGTAAAGRRQRRPCRRRRRPSSPQPLLRGDGPHDSGSKSNGETARRGCQPAIRSPSATCPAGRRGESQPIGRWRMHGAVEEVARPVSMRLGDSHSVSSRLTRPRRSSHAGPWSRHRRRFVAAEARRHGRAPWPPSTWGPTPSAWSSPRSCPTAASRSWSGLQRAVRLGQDAFRRGRLGAASMRAAVAVLRDYQQLLQLYQVERVRAVATSAAREAGNADTFLDRIFMATGLNVEVIGTSEESRLTVSAVLPGGGRRPGREPRRGPHRRRRRRQHAA